MNNQALWHFAEGLLLSYEKGKKGECYILSGQQISVRQLLKFLEGISGVNAPSFKITYQVARVAGFFNVLYCNLMKIKPLFTPFSIDVLANNSLISCQKAQDELGYSSRSIYESIKDTVRWFRQEEVI